MVPFGTHHMSASWSDLGHTSEVLHPSAQSIGAAFSAEGNLCIGKKFNRPTFAPISESWGRH